MPKEQLTREQAIEYLISMKMLVEQSPDWPTAKLRLAEAAKSVGYRPIVRCLILDLEPEKCIKNGEL